MKCPQCGANHWRETDAGHSSYTMGTNAKGHRVMEYKSESHYMCMMCGYIRSSKSESKSTLKVTKKFVPLVGWVEFTEPVEDGDD